MSQAQTARRGGRGIKTSHPSAVSSGGASGAGGSGGDKPPHRHSRFPESLLILSADDDIIDWLKRIIGQIIMFQRAMDSLVISDEFVRHLASRFNVFLHNWIMRGKVHAKMHGAITDADGLLPLTHQDLRHGLAALLGIQAIPGVQRSIINAKMVRHGDPQDIDKASAIGLVLSLPYLPWPSPALASSGAEVGYSKTRVKPKNWSLCERSFRFLPSEDSKLARDLTAAGVVGVSNHPPMMVMVRLIRGSWCQSDDMLWFAAAAQFLIRRILLSIDEKRREVGSQSYQHFNAHQLQWFIDHLPPDLCQIMQLLEVRQHFLSRQEFDASARALELSSDEPQPPKRQRHD